MAEPAMDSRTPHPGTPPAWHSLAPSAVWVFSKFISYSSQVHYYISQDLLQLRYHVTELWAMDRVGRRNVNDFRDYSHKTIPRDPCFSFPVCQLDADNSAGTFRSPRRWQVQRRRSQRPWMIVWSSLSLSSPCGLDISGKSDFLSVAAGFLKSQCSKRLRQNLQGFFWPSLGNLSIFPTTFYWLQASHRTSPDSKGG